VSEIPLHDVHRLLDLLDTAVGEIDAARSAKSIKVEQLPVLSEVVLEVLDWSNTAYVENKLGVNPSILNKFVRMRGSVNPRQARMLADRLRTYLRSEDQRTVPSAIRPQTAQLQIASEPPAVTIKAVRPAVTIKAEQWVQVATTSQIKAKIAVVSALLDDIIVQVSRANAPEEDQVLTQLERQQLIAILETALQVLKSPLIERGLIKKAADMMKKGATSAAEKGLQRGLGLLMTEAGQRLLELLHMIWK
jgi:hypothetical protein